MEDLLDRFRDALRGITGGEPGIVLVAVSGGPDSVCLLDLLLRFSTEAGGNFQVCAAHLDHGLRGNESTGDSRFVEDLCRTRNVPLTSTSANVEDQRENNESLEQAARRIRYTFLERAAHTAGAKWIATGHNADDQTETLLMRIDRGTGIEGLLGVLRRRTVEANSEIEVIRPILGITRTEIVDYLRSRSIQWRTDSSNADLRFSRNRVRLWLSNMPEQYRYRLRDTLDRLSMCASKDWPEIRQTALDSLARALTPDTYNVSIDITQLTGVDPLLLPYIAREMIRRHCGSLRRITRTHIEAVTVLMNPDETTGRTGLPLGLEAVREYDVLHIRPAVTASPETAQVDLPVPGEAVLPDGTVITAELVNGDSMERARSDADDPCIEYANATGINGPLVVRYRRPGDTFHPLGAPGSKKVKDFLIDMKVPRSKRDNIPLITCTDSIVWLAGLRLDDSFRLAGSGPAVRLSCRSAD